MSSPLQSFKWHSIAKHVYDEYLSKPYTSNSIESDWEYTFEGLTIPRPNHGLAHTLRTASYVSIVVKTYNFFNKASLTTTDINHIQVALLFYVIGRENEASFGHPDYSKSRQKAADAFELYVKKYLVAQFTNDQTQFYKQGILNAYGTSPAQYLIMRTCHDLDLLRCYSKTEYDKKVVEASRYVGPLAQPLAELAEECLYATGDRIMGKQSYNGPLFISCSTNVEKALKRIDKAFKIKLGAIMQKINPSLPIPSGLTAPVPTTPWNISPVLFDRIKQAPTDPSVPYKKCVVLSTDPEAAFILQYFMHQKPHNYGIKAIYCIHNSAQTNNFANGIEIIENEANNRAVYFPKGKEEEPKKQREEVIERWRECTDSFSPIKIVRPLRTDTYTEAKVLPLWHGSTPTKCHSICTSGFTYFGKQHKFNSDAQQGANSSTDIGYFGSGMYFTNSAHYASMYSSGNLLLAWVSMREPYPVVNDVPFPNQGSDMIKLKGHKHYQNYNAHYIPVASKDPLNPNCMEYYPCYHGQVPAWDEIVVFEKHQSVARFWIELSLDSIELPFPIPNSPVMPATQKSSQLSQPPSTPLFKKLNGLKAIAAKNKAKDPPVLQSIPPKKASCFVQKPAQPIEESQLVTPLQAALVEAIPVKDGSLFKKKPAQPIVKTQLVAPLQADLVQALPAWVFGASEWKRYIGDPGEEPPLPSNIVALLGKLESTNVLVLIPKTVNDIALDLKYLGTLVQKPLAGHQTKYERFSLGETKDKSVSYSHWALLTRNIIEGSRNRKFKDEHMIINEYCKKTGISYTVPTVLDTTICLFMEYVRNGVWLYPKGTHTWCQEWKKTKTHRVVVGGGTEVGLNIWNNHSDDGKSEIDCLSGLYLF